MTVTKIGAVVGGILTAATLALLPVSASAQVQAPGGSGFEGSWHSPIGQLNAWPYQYPNFGTWVPQDALGAPVGAQNGLLGSPGNYAEGFGHPTRIHPTLGTEAQPMWGTPGEYSVGFGTEAQPMWGTPAPYEIGAPVGVQAGTLGLQGFGSPGNYAEGFGHPTRIHPTLGTEAQPMWGTPGEYSVGFGLPNDFTLGAPYGIHPSLGTWTTTQIGVPHAAFGTPSEPWWGADQGFTPALGGWPTAAVGIPMGGNGIGIPMGGNGIGVPYDSCCVGVPGVASGGYGQLGTGQYEPDMGVRSSRPSLANYIPYYYDPYSSATFGGWPVERGTLGLQGFGTEAQPTWGVQDNPYAIGVPYDSCCVGVPGVASSGYGQLGTGQYEPDMGVRSSRPSMANYIPYYYDPYSSATFGGWPTAAVGGWPTAAVGGWPTAAVGGWPTAAVGVPYDSCCVGVPGMTGSDGQVFGGVPSIY